MKAFAEKRARPVHPTGPAGPTAPSSRQEIRRITSGAGILQRTPSPAPARATPEDIAEFEALQDRFFAGSGERIREHILQQLGFQLGQRPTTPDEALRVTTVWGVTKDVLVRELQQLTAALSGAVQGQHTPGSLAQIEQQAVAALSATGQSTLRQARQRVEAEPFWRQHLAANRIYIVPDSSGANRYRGYTQHGTERTAGAARPTPVFIIHISKDPLDAGDVEGTAATLIHELSHTLYDPNVLERSMKPFLGELTTLLLDHPDIAALRAGAADPVQAREAQAGRIRQILYEVTGYSEEEIFVHLQQLSAMPSTVTIDGQQVRGTDYILDRVQLYVDRLKQIGLPPRMQEGILNQIGRRVAILYDRRIAAATTANEKRRLTLNKEMAAQILVLTRSGALHQP